MLGLDVVSQVQTHKMLFSFFWLFAWTVLTTLATTTTTTTTTGEVVGGVEQIRLSLMDESTICVMWNSTQPMESRVHYFKGECNTPPSDDHWHEALGTNKPYYASPDGASGVLHKVFLENLESGSEYCYWIGTQEEEAERQNEVGEDSSRYMSRYKYAFRTANTHQAVFAALADAGTWGDAQTVFANLANDQDVTMVVHAGDLSYGLTDQVWDTFGRMVEPITRTRAYMVGPGNWDVRNANATRAFLDRYTMPLATPLPEELPLAPPINYFYSFNYSVFHIVMLSSYDVYDSSSVQYKWLEQDLHRANQDRTRRPWIIVCFHSPMYSSNSGHGGGDNKFRLAIEPLLTRFYVDVILTGHDHGYERSYPVKDNVVKVSQDHRTHYTRPGAPIHILVGTAGASLDTWLEQPPWSAYRESSFGYTKLSADEHVLQVVYTRHNETIADRFTISKGGGRKTFRYVIGVGLVIFFAVLPAVLYKGLPTFLRNFLLCYDEPSNFSPSSSSSSSSTSKHPDSRGLAHV